MGQGKKEGESMIGLGGITISSGLVIRVVSFELAEGKGGGMLNRGPGKECSKT